MINYYHLENFKSIKSMGLTFYPLTTFMGMNGAGKSSVIQSLLILRQSLLAQSSRNSLIHGDDRYNREVSLMTNGPLTGLGTAQDVLCQNAEENYIRMRLSFTDGTKFSANFPIEEGRPDTYISGNYETTGTILEEALLSERFAYLAAEHLGPKNIYSAYQWNMSALNLLGNEGEYTVPFLGVNGEKINVPEAMHHPVAKTRSLIDETSAWMREVSSNIRMTAVYNAIEQTANLNIAYDGKDMTTENISPVNVGFGIPYVLPLIVLLLNSKPGDLILIENPESHLHPRGQAKIAELIARAVANGAQIICETHSDHVINEFRVAVKNGIINKDDLGLDYFDRDVELDSTVTEISVDAHGSLSEYPNGLLDEWGNLMAELI